MTILALCCRSWPAGGPPAPLAGPDEVVVREVGARPGRAELDPLLAEVAPSRVVVAGTDGDLAAVVLRLLRTERLAATEVAFLPASP
ncbi:MAG: hypothetical protein J2P20_05750, partial [Pseudonocardia sp.]|nr:hypothetical protein [Pseudonocardia sp.]